MSVAPAQAAIAAEVTKPVEYTVVSGDYLDKIATEHGTTWQKLFNKNTSIKDPNLIYVGEKLAIPTADEVVPERTQEAPVSPPAPEAVQTPAPAPAPAPAPVTTASNLTGCDLARSLINQYDWNKEVAYQVMMAESHCNPNAANLNDVHGSCVGSFGLFQINCGHGQLYDPATNVAVAYNMYKQSGWQPWGFTTCAVKVACY